MSTHSYVGNHDLGRTGKVRLRYVHSDGNPGRMIPALRKIWVGAAAGDTTRLAELLLGHDWDYLDPDTTTDSGEAAFAGEQLIAGVGMTLAATDDDGHVLPPEPVTVVALNATGDLDAQWIYLLDLGRDTVTMYTSGGTVYGTEPLAS
ncbi:hypothetical protein [Actinoplanes sp. NPDC026623]|uniref:hypothetical protein n=1 Tax=Actinoplanes sp. NPDC026623 TaxID=3155610 RepID=UPI0033F125D2